MMRGLISFLTLFLWVLNSQAQSLELMPGTERIFLDAQWLKTMDAQKKWSIFSRSRATVDYTESTNLFTGAYLNYTSKSGFGGTVLGRISTMSAGGDAGVHYFRARKSYLIYALASVELQSDLAYSWFSIIRFNTSLNESWKMYSSLELFTKFNSDGHVASVQRMRLGLDQKGYQFGLGLNLSGLGKDYDTTDVNPGIFIRRQF